GEVQHYSTPRRLIVAVSGVQDQQPDMVADVRGPSAAAAYDAEGKPTKALEGFLRGQGATLESVRKDGDYVWVSKTTIGRPTREVLADLLPVAVKSLSFDKSMRWGSSRMRFARPIRWMLASFGGELVNFEIEGVRSGLESRGHRFLNPEKFEAKTLDELLNGLLMRNVEPDPREREKRIREGATIIATGTPLMTDSLVSENVNLTEWPSPLEGEFRVDFLDLPEPVLITAMAKHEKMFPVRDRAGNLINKFIFVRNSGEEAVVREGNAWVLNARFNDAKFFYDEDKHHGMDAFLAKTGGMLFQEKLGTVLDRAYRLEKLAAFIAEQIGADAALAAKAALYAKADLSTGLVSELPALQGAIGAEYAKRAGFEPEVCRAIEVQYEPAKVESGDLVAACVVLADQLDKLSGYLGLGLLPSGSSDPVGLRRAGATLLEISSVLGDRLSDFSPLVDKAVSLYEGHAFDPNAVTLALSDILEGRYEVTYSSVRHDVLAAALGPNLQPSLVSSRVTAMQLVQDDVAFIQTASRPLNLAEAARKKGETLDLNTTRLDSPEGEALRNAVNTVAERVKSVANAADLIAALKTLDQPINAFFDSTMVMAEDPAIRASRLGLLQLVADLLNQAGDFTKLVS
ncbi:MAG TPA: glycine--tRNA ligase subunit beta, partial [Fimbriimonadaceae bacterium]|nr:glycine--tRNA ligase subunit beta [Fimbriimonadaceae bacterium]